MPSISVWVTPLIDVSMKGVTSFGYTVRRPGGKNSPSSFKRARTASAVSSALAFGASWIPRPDADLPL